jgi:hypothetical protein
MSGPDNPQNTALSAALKRSPTSPDTLDPKSTPETDDSPAKRKQKKASAKSKGASAEG